MRLLIVAVCVALCSAEKLDNTYLPPNTAFSAGGNGNFLATPKGGSGFGAGGFSGSGFGAKGFGGGFGGSGSFGGKGSGFGGKPSGFGESGSFGGFSGAAVNRPFPAVHDGPSPAYGAPEHQGQGARGHFGQQIPILKLDNENFGDGSYRYEYATGNGIQAQEAGQQKNLGHEQGNDVHGSFAYTGDDGAQYSVSYIADENGFQPQGAHLPTPPPVPEAILKSLQQNAAEEAHHPQRHQDEGQYDQSSHHGGQYSESHHDGQYSESHHGGQYQESGHYQGGQSQGIGGFKAGGFGGQKSGGAFGSQHSGSLGGQHPGGFGTQHSGTQHNAGFGAQHSAGFGAQHSAGYGGQQSGGFGTQHSGAFGSQQSAGFGGQKSGGFGNQKAGGFGGQHSGGFATQQSGGFGSFSSATNRQYLAPHKQSFNPNTGYNY